MSTFRLHHIGYVVADMKIASDRFTALGYSQETDVIADKMQKVNVMFMKSSGGGVIELIEPLSIDSPVSKRLESAYGIGPYHLCFEVEDIPIAVRELRLNGFIPTGKASFSPALHMRIQFLYSREIGLIEIAEAGSKISTDAF